MSPYLRGLLAEDEISDAEYRVLAAAGARSPQELYALTVHFANLFVKALPGGNLARISAVAARKTNMAFQNMVLTALASPKQIPMGANQPPSAFPPLGKVMGLGAVPANGSMSGALGAIDHHSVVRSTGWPVKDQGQRGTCVAHSMIACKEHLASLSRSGPPGDQSEQYLFWGAKQLDQDPSDGTTLTHALDSLRKYGSCDEATWPYVGAPVPGSVHHGPPPPGATAAGLVSLHNGGGVSNSAKAFGLYQQLQNGPVSIGVPVFVDPNTPQLNNWNVGYFYDLGIVAEPPPFSVVAGGHAVCVVGFTPDSTEPAGVGWFIIRNSWGPSFGQNLPNPGSACGPEPGYGQISWSYVDQFLWEMSWL